MATEIKISEDWTITGGPSREELFDALRLFGERRRVEFTFHREESPKKIRLRTQINLIEVEDGMGEKWILEVYFVPDDGLYMHPRGPYELYYDTITRKGKITDARKYGEKYHIDRDGVIWRGMTRIGQLTPEQLAI